MTNLQLKMMWMHVLACLLLAPQVAHALSRTDCTRFDMTLAEEKILELLCTREAILSGHLVFGNPEDNHKFFVCTDATYGCSGTCENGEVFDKTSSTCRSGDIKCILPAGSDVSIPLQPLGSMFQNPCARAGSKTCSLFDANLKNRFIVCERSTTQVPMVGQCLAGFEFSFVSQTCVKVTEQITMCDNGKNPCKPIPVGEKVITADRLYFGCHDDPTKFIHCDRPGNMKVKQCKNKTVWSQKDLTCVSQ